MKPFKIEAVCHSCQEKENHFKEVEILSEDGPNNVIAKVDGKTCTAIFNWFNGNYYVDDVDGIISEKKEVK